MIDWAQIFTGWDTASEKTGIWQLPIVSSVFKSNIYLISCFIPKGTCPITPWFKINLMQYYSDPSAAASYVVLCCKLGVIPGYTAVMLYDFWLALPEMEKFTK